MRSYSIVVVALTGLALPALAAAQPDPPRRPTPRIIVGEAQGRDRDLRAEQRETFTKTVRLGGNGVIDISNLSGNVEIQRGGGSDAAIEVTKVARGRTEEHAREMLALVTPEIAMRGERLEIKTIYPHTQHMPAGGRREISVAVHYRITAPQNTRIRATALSGNLKATDMRGELSLTTTRGDVTITNASRVAAAKTTSGKVEVTNVDSDTALDVSAINGSVVLRNVKARRIEAGCVTGRVIIQDVETERLNAQTVTGELDFSGPLARAGRYDLKSHSGDIRVAISGGTGFELEASTFSGHVESGFKLTGGEQTTGRGGRRNSITGTVGDGSASMDLTTFSGNVYVVKR